MAKANNKVDEPRENKNFKNPKEAIPRLAREAIDAGATIKEVATILKIDEDTAAKLINVTPQDARQIEFFVKPGDEFDTNFDKTPSMFKQLADRISYAIESGDLPSVDKPDVTLPELIAQSKPSLPSVSVPNVNVDRPEVTLTDLMSQSRPSVSVPNIPSAGSPQGYNPYTQSIDLGRQQPVLDPADEVLAPIRKEISPMGTYGMTREEFEAARGPRIGDVKRSDVGGVLKDLKLELPDSLIKSIEDYDYEERLAEYRKQSNQPADIIPSDFPDDLKASIQAQLDEEEKLSRGFAREVAGGFTLQAADELEALVASKQKGTSYAVEKDRIDKEREEFRYLNPGAGALAEGIGIVPGGVMTAAGLGRAGIVRIPEQGAI